MSATSTSSASSPAARSESNYRAARQGPRQGRRLRTMALLDGIDELDTAAAQASPLASRDAFG
jgi:hypothetical protein